MIAYAVTDPSLLSFETLKSDLQRIRDRGAEMILYRDKTAPNYPDRAELFIREARRIAFDKVLLHGDPYLAKLLEADGVHLRSEQSSLIPDAKTLGLLTIFSAHSLQELQDAQIAGADFATLSPLFDSPGKGKPLGPKRFAEWVSRVNLPVIALGGIVTREQIDIARACGAAGFASIRYFS